MYICILLTGCTTSKSYTFKVETGDEIEVKLNTNDGYDITSDLPFSVLKDEETLVKVLLLLLISISNIYLQLIMIVMLKLLKVQQKMI